MNEMSVKFVEYNKYINKIYNLLNEIQQEYNFQMILKYFPNEI